MLEIKVRPNKNDIKQQKKKKKKKIGGEQKINFLM